MLFKVNLFTVLFLFVFSVNLASSANINFPFANYVRHKTNMFYNRRGSIDGYVFRRAANISITIDLEQSVENLKSIQLSLDFESKLTVMVPSEDSFGFRFFHTPISKTTVLGDIWIPETAAIGVWRFNIIILTTRNKQVYVTPKIYILFNPWSHLDDVYMSETAKLEEYVGNEVGFLYEGEYTNVHTRVWLYDQFKFSTLRSVMYVLQKQVPSPTFRNDPVLLVRALSAAMNAQDDEGVLEGKWTEPFPIQYPKPWDWLGSSPILVQYYLTNGKPVKYGQCWVFASVFTTILRSLGIPSRPVTNFNSAHLGEKDFVLDRIIADKKNLGRDDYWNYHVWTEAWMKRKDLSPVDVGWQATDGTPQEPSDTGYFQLGPASVSYIRRAKVNHPNDAWFVYSEVNADLLDWKKDEAGDYKKTGPPRTDFIGKFILTKNIFPSYLTGVVTQHEDITQNYKPLEGTAEERASFQAACKEFGVTPYLKPTLKREAIEDPIILHIHIANTMIGQPLIINIVVSNNWFLERSVDLNVKVCSNYYDGKIKANIKDKTVRYKLSPNEERHLRMILQPDDYLRKLESNALLKIHASADVIGSNSYSFKARDFMFTKPTLGTNFKKEVKVGEDEIIKIRMHNPLPHELTFCQLHLQGLCGNQKTVYLRNIGIGETYVIRELLYYEYDCVETLVINLSCNELNDIRGYAMFIVRGNSFQKTQFQINNQYNPLNAINSMNTINPINIPLKYQPEYQH